MSPNPITKDRAYVTWSIPSYDNISTGVMNKEDAILLAYVLSDQPNLYNIEVIDMKGTES